MSNYKQKQKWETWTCKCGIERKIREKNKSCPVCKEYPKKEEKETATKSKFIRHFKLI